MRMAGAVLAIVLAAAPAAAQEELRGTWRGSYACAQGNTALALTIEPRKDGTLSALFHFEAAPDNPEVPTGCFEMEGRFTPETREVLFLPRRWLHRPPNYVGVGLQGRLAEDGTGLEGQVRGPGCARFQVMRAAEAASAEACRTGAPLLSLR